VYDGHLRANGHVSIIDRLQSCVVDAGGCGGDESGGGSGDWSRVEAALRTLKVMVVNRPLHQTELCEHAPFVNALKVLLLTGPSSVQRLCADMVGALAVGAQDVQTSLVLKYGMADVLQQGLRTGSLEVLSSVLDAVRCLVVRNLNVTEVFVKQRLLEDLNRFLDDGPHPDIQASAVWVIGYMVMALPPVDGDRLCPAPGASGLSPSASTVLTVMGKLVCLLDSASVDVLHRTAETLEKIAMRLVWAAETKTYLAECGVLERLARIISQAISWRHGLVEPITTTPASSDLHLVQFVSTLSVLLLGHRENQAWVGRNLSFAKDLCRVLGCQVAGCCSGDGDGIGVKRLTYLKQLVGGILRTSAAAAVNDVVSPLQRGGIIGHLVDVVRGNAEASNCCHGGGVVGGVAGGGSSNAGAGAGAGEGEGVGVGVGVGGSASCTTVPALSPDFAIVALDVIVVDNQPCMSVLHSVCGGHQVLADMLKTCDGGCLDGSVGLGERSILKPRPEPLSRCLQFYGIKVLNAMARDVKGVEVQLRKQYRKGPELETYLYRVAHPSFPCRSLQQQALVALKWMDLPATDAAVREGGVRSLFAQVTPVAVTHVSHMCSICLGVGVGDGGSSDPGDSVGAGPGCPARRVDSVVYLPCFHCFHVNCIKKCFHTKDVCPVCKTADVLRHLQLGIVGEDFMATPTKCTTRTRTT
jgi:hypothetical protein